MRDDITRKLTDDWRRILRDAILAGAGDPPAYTMRDILRWPSGMPWRVHKLRRSVN